MNFHANKSIQYSRTEVASEFTKDQNEKKINDYVKANNQILDNETPKFK